MTAPKTDLSSQLDLADSWKMPASRHPVDARLDRGLMDNGHEGSNRLPPFGLQIRQKAVAAYGGSPDTTT